MVLKEGYIKLKKVKGVRKRFYELTSIAYYNYLQLFRILKSNSELYSRLNLLNDELNVKRSEFKNIYGYSIINAQVNQFLKAWPLVEKLVLLFKEAMERFKE